MAVAGRDYTFSSTFRKPADVRGTWSPKRGSRPGTANRSRNSRPSSTGFRMSSTGAFLGLAGAGRPRTAASSSSSLSRSLDDLGFTAKLDGRRRKLLLLQQKQHMVETTGKQLWANSARATANGDAQKEDIVRRVSMELDDLLSCDDFYVDGNPASGELDLSQAQRRLDGRVQARMADMAAAEDAKRAERRLSRAKAKELLDAASRPAVARRSTYQEPPPASNDQLRAFKRAEQLMKRQIREQWYELSKEVKRRGTHKLSEDDMKGLLFRFNIVVDDFHYKHLIAKIDTDRSGDVSVSEFLKFFGKGSESDKNVHATMHRMPVRKAQQLVLERIESKLKGGPGGLQLAFKFFDRDRSGSISHDEFKHALQHYTMLDFDDETFMKLMEVYDSDGSGVIDFRKFCENVMGSDSSKRSSLMRDMDNLKKVGQVSDDRGNSVQMIKRKVRTNWKELTYSLQRLDPHGKGNIVPARLRKVLFDHDIDMADSQWSQMVMDLDSDNDGRICTNEFLQFFGKGGEDDLMMVSSKPVRASTRKAKAMIREGIEAKTRSGPGGLLRAFQFFDRDRSGSISYDEFKRALKDYTMLVFEENTINTVMREYDDDNSGEINFSKFCSRVMGSSKDCKTSVGAGPTSFLVPQVVDVPSRPSSAASSFMSETGYGHELLDEQQVRTRQSNMFESSLNVDNAKLAADRAERDLQELPQTNADYDAINGLGLGTLTSVTKGEASHQDGTTDAMLNRKIREIRRTDLNREFMKAADKDGGMAPHILRRVLASFHVIIPDKLFDHLIEKIDANHDGIITQSEFLDYMRESGQAVEQKFTATIRNVTLKEAKKMIRHRVRLGVKKGRSATQFMRQQFKFFDTDGNGTIDPDEFKKGLQIMNLEFEDHILQQLFSACAKSQREITYHQFCSMILGHKAESRGHLGLDAGAAKKSHLAQAMSLKDASLHGARSGKDLMTLIEQKIEQKAKNVRVVFRKFDEDRSGSVTPDEFRNGLATLGIVCADDEFTRLMDIVDHDGGGDINYNEFAQKLKQHDAQTHDGFSFEEKKIAHAAQGISHDDAVLHHGGALRGAEELITMIAHKVEQKSKNVKTVYRLFDNDSSMGVDRSEFVTGLQKLGLALSTKELDSVLHVIDADGSGEIDFNEFTSALKESDGQTHDHFAHHHKDKKKVQAAQRMSIKDGHQTGKRREGLQLLSMIRSKVEEKAKNMHSIFRKFDVDHDGFVSADEFEQGLADLGVPLHKDELRSVMALIDQGKSAGKSLGLDLKQFAEAIKGKDQTHDSFSTEKAKTAMTMAVSHQDAALHHGGVQRSGKEILRTIEQKAEQKAKNLRVVFRKFDDDGSGTVSHEEFRTGLVHMGIAMSDPEFKSLIDIVDHDGGGDIDYREFANNFKSQAGHHHDPFSGAVQRRDSVSSVSSVATSSRSIRSALSGRRRSIGRPASRGSTTAFQGFDMTLSGRPPSRAESRGSVNRART